MDSTEFTSESNFNMGSDDKKFNYFMFIILIIILFIITVYCNKLYLCDNDKKEGMSGGTLTQLFAQDSQDVYLKSNVDKLATGNFRMMWNEPTMITQSFQNRGSPLSTFILPDTSMNPNPYALEASNNYVDSVLNTRAKPANFTNPVLSLKDVLPVQDSKQYSSDSTHSGPKPRPRPRKTVSNTKARKSNVIPMESSDSGNYENVRTEIPRSSDYSAQTDNQEQTKPLRPTNSVPTIPNNILPSSLPMPSNPNLPPNPYELANVAKQVATTEKTANNLPPMTQWKPLDYLYQGYYDNLLYNKNCIKSPASCGNNSGGFRLGEDFNEPTKALPYVQIDNNILYPDSYTGTYFIEPNFDIMKPFPVILDKDRV